MPCVIVNVMRGGPSTGMPTRPAQGDIMQSRWGSHGDYPIIVVAPASVQEIYSETKRAFNLAEHCRTPVVVLYDEVIAQLIETVALPGGGADRRPTTANGRRRRARLPALLPSADRVPAMSRPGDGHRVHTTGLTHAEDGFPTQNPKSPNAQRTTVRQDGAQPRPDRLLGGAADCDDAEVLIVAIGIVARAARRAVDDLRAQGIRAGLFRPVTLWPFPERPCAQRRRARAPCWCRR